MADRTAARSPTRDFDLVHGYRQERSKEDKEGMLDQIERNIELAGPLDEEQRRFLLDIANKCPVHRTLTSEIVIRTRLVSPGPPDGRS